MSEPDPGLRSPEQLAAYLGVSKRTLTQWRGQKKGPRWLQIGRHVRYLRADTQRWLDEGADSPEQALTVDQNYATTTVPPPRRSSPYAERNAEIARRIQAGERPIDVAKDLGLTRERVRQIAQKFDIIPREIQAEASKQRREEKRAEYEATHSRECVVCRKTFVGAKNAMCCGAEDCVYVLRAGRSYLFPEHYEQQRRSQAKSILRHPETHTSGQITYAQNVLNGTMIPRERYVIPGSKIALVLKRVGREDLIPGVPRHSKPEKLSYVCRATSLNGKSCTRPVGEEGALCHIHGRAKQHVF